MQANVRPATILAFVRPQLEAPGGIITHGGSAGRSKRTTGVRRGSPKGGLPPARVRFT
jgi:hypothetical protein